MTMTMRLGVLALIITAAVASASLTIIATDGPSQAPVAAPEVVVTLPNTRSVPVLSQSQQLLARTTVESDASVIALIGRGAELVEVVPLLDASGDLFGAAVIVELDGARTIGGRWRGIDWHPTSRQPRAFTEREYDGTYENVRTLRILIEFDSEQVIGISPENLDARRSGAFEAIER